MRRILVLFVFLICFIQTARTQQDRFYSPSHGLSGTLIQGMTEDSRGYLWISTYSGLNRFDGYNFKVYQFTAEDTTSINSTDVYETLEDSRGNLWVGTNTGFNRYDYQLDCFKRISFPSLPDSLELEVNDLLEGPDRNIWLITSYGLVCLNPETLESDFFNTRFDNDGVPSPASFIDAVFDPSGNIWIITRNQGLLVFNPEERKFYTLSEYLGFDYEYLSKARAIREILITPKGEILIGERNALMVYDFYKKKFSRFPFLKANDGEDSGGVYSISQEKNGEIWVGTARGGLYRVDRLNNCLTEANSAIQMEDIDKSSIICYVGPSGNTWYGIKYRGIYLKVPSLQPFHAIHGFRSGGNNLSYPLIQSILKDHNGTLWVGTDGGGLNYKKDGESKFHSFDRIVNPETKVPARVVMCLLEDSRGWIWVGTYMDGLYCYRADGSAPVRYPLMDPDRGIQQLNIYDLKEDYLGNLWIGTLGSGLFYLDVEKGVVRSYKKPVVKGIARAIDPYVNDVLLVADGTVWIATYDGLYAWNEKKEFFSEFSTTTTEDMDNDAIFTLVEDDAHDIWFGSFSGLFHLDQKGNIVKKYTTEDGLPNNTVMSLQKDGRGALWISTTNGLSRLDIKGEVFRNFYEYDGLPCNEFKPGSSFRDAQGNMYFGGVNGLVYFHPDSIKESPVSPTLLLTHFRIFDKYIDRGTLADGRVILSKSINETDTISLRHKDNSFTFEFAAIDFQAPEKIKYAVMMEGFDKNWVTKDYQQRYATYTNLSPGSYVFKVNSTNRDGVWSEHPREILVIISPPFWRTWWAYVLYGVLL
ncbi:MAG: two-component regulator propeller domain-containing protein, partial [Bacteroidales bacterium]|nr:two-component regulator propeller domain-containing protein [Bacteroidales bacterium]